jgi:hypothetical protein
MVLALVSRLVDASQRTVGVQARHFAHSLIVLGIAWVIASVLMSQLELPVEQANSAKFFDALAGMTTTMSNNSKCNATVLAESLDSIVDSFVDSSLCSKPVYNAFQWDLKGAFYFVFTTFTMIGYGTYVPSTNGGKLLSLGAACFSLPVVGYLFATTGKMFEGALHRRMRWAREHHAAATLVASILLNLSWMLGGAGYYAHWEGWSFGDALYFMFISTTTIGKPCVHRPQYHRHRYCSSPPPAPPPWYLGNNRFHRHLRLRLRPSPCAHPHPHPHPPASATRFRRLRSVGGTARVLVVPHHLGGAAHDEPAAERPRLRCGGGEPSCPGSAPPPPGGEGGGGENPEQVAHEGSPAKGARISACSDGVGDGDGDKEGRCSGGQRTSILAL